MEIAVRTWQEKDLPAMIQIWNEVVEEGIAFPQEELLTTQSGRQFFAEQTVTAVAVDEDISVMPVMRWHLAAEESMWERKWC